MAMERAKIGNLGQTKRNIVQNFEFLRFWRGKLHLDRRNMPASQSFSNNLLGSAFVYFYAEDRHSQSQWVKKYETVAKYTNRITDSENFEFLIIFGAKILHFASQSDQNRGK